ncbi:uncharacterized protein LOC111373083 [Olea europaea var. sylvestris]|uniref:uncharacterized protein LOC111373083 n=1 Tax=Olea europaea var. sylvestris TaxID=158386 RepID=UPI000C1D0021|nr:uncharacterized protein LOC111373083 [Olea europaea var. sylvestris]
MPQVDLDRKIVCETLADEDLPKNEEIPDSAGSVHVPPAPDYPPESFWLSKDAEYDWLDRNAFYECKESTRGNSNSTNLNPSIIPNSNSNSQRVPVNFKSKVSIIGLPKTQKTSYVDSKRRCCKPTNIRLFPKRSESVVKRADSVAEPSSPKVSCMGRVRSKSGRRRSNSLKMNAEKTRARREKQKIGFYSKLMSVIFCMKVHSNPVRSGSRRVVVEEAVEPQRKSVSVKLREIPVSDWIGRNKTVLFGPAVRVLDCEGFKSGDFDVIGFRSERGTTAGKLITDGAYKSCVEVERGAVG